jgi:hypothetical protein
MLKEVGLVANVIGNLQSFFSSSAYHERIEAGLLGTLDGIMFWIDNPVKSNGQPYTDDYVKKMIAHYLKQYKANRKKLK